MRILLTNDDGYAAEGLHMLHRVCREFGDVDVVAPLQNKSGSSSALTLRRPVAVELRQAAVDMLAHVVDGTPCDCVHLAVHGALVERPDIVLSGINHGANLGDDTLYSGTVAAAMEAHMAGIAAAAISYCGREGIAQAAPLVRQVIRRVIAASLVQPALLVNVNIPDGTEADAAELAMTHLGRRAICKPPVAQMSPAGKKMYWIGGLGEEPSGVDGSDFHAIRSGRVSITPLQVDFTQHAAMAELHQWLAAADHSELTDCLHP